MGNWTSHLHLAVRKSSPLRSHFQQKAGEEPGLLPPLCSNEVVPPKTPRKKPKISEHNMKMSKFQLKITCHNNQEDLKLNEKKIINRCPH